MREIVGQLREEIIEDEEEKRKEIEIKEKAMQEDQSIVLKRC